MKLTSLGAVLVSLSIVSCQTQRQTLQPELARQVDGIFRKWDRPDSPGCASGRLGRPQKFDEVTALEAGLL
jgi:hypothetical protein